jgi:hypothetical protein
MKQNDRRLSLLFTGTTAFLLLMTLFLISENNQKYSTAFEAVASSIVSTNRALVAPEETRSSIAILTGLPRTQTRASIPQTSTQPYDPTLYAQRQQLYMHLATTSDPTALMEFMLTEQALAAAYQSTPPAP